MTMTGMVLVFGLLFAMVLAGVWPIVRDWNRSATQPEPAAAEPVRDPAPASLEGSLVAGLLRHEFSAPQYRRAMERVAQRDDGRFPLRVPTKADQQDQGPW